MRFKATLKALIQFETKKYIYIKFIKRHFKDHKMLTKPILENCFKNAFVGETTRDFEDVARILCLFVCANIIFPDSWTLFEVGFRQLYMLRIGLEENQKTTYD